MAAPSAPPLLMLVGGRDDWAPPEPCEKLAETAKAEGRPVSIVVYADAYHHFDGADMKKRVYSSVARGGKGATMEYNPKAHADSEKQVRNFLEAHMKP
jgi:dienelactone hydrolase